MPVLYPLRGGHRKAFVQHNLRSRVFWISLFFLLLLGGVAASGQWVYGKWTNRQSWKLISHAEARARKGRVDEALMSLETALRLRPDHPAALRTRTDELVDAILTAKEEIDAKLATIVENR